MSEAQIQAIIQQASSASSASALLDLAVAASAAESHEAGQVVDAAIEQAFTDRKIKQLPVTSRDMATLSRARKTLGIYAQPPHPAG